MKAFSLFLKLIKKEFSNNFSMNFYQSIHFFLSPPIFQTNEIDTHHIPPAAINQNAYKNAQSNSIQGGTVKYSGKQWPILAAKWGFSGLHTPHYKYYAKRDTLGIRPRS